MTSATAFKILVVDDHPETLSIIERVLQQQGYNVLTARSGFRALSLAKSENPDMMLVDGMMPEMDGWEVCRRLRAMPQMADLPIIMFTAVDEADRKLAGFDAGADDYITKPTEPAELLERVKSMLEARTPKASDKTRLHKPLEKAKNRSSDSSASLADHTISLPKSGSLTAILGARGGAGATTLAINLASSLASSKHATTLVDLDLIQGHVALYLSQKHKHGLNNVLTQPESQWSDFIEQELSHYNDQFNLLLTHAPLAKALLSLQPEQTPNLLRPLLKPNAHLVVDCGHELTPVVDSVLAQATQIIVCLRPERVALANARQLLDHLHRIAPNEAQVRAVIFDFSGQMAIPRESLEKFLNHPVTAILPVSPAEMNHSVNKSTPLVQLNPQAKAAMLIRQLAKQIVKA